jgi:hypothetical protein
MSRVVIKSRLASLMLGPWIGTMNLVGQPFVAPATKGCTPSAAGFVVRAPPVAKAPRCDDLTDYPL